MRAPSRSASLGDGSRRSRIRRLVLQQAVDVADRSRPSSSRPPPRDAAADAAAWSANPSASTAGAAASPASSITGDFFAGETPRAHCTCSGRPSDGVSTSRWPTTSRLAPWPATPSVPSGSSSRPSARWTNRSPSPSASRAPRGRGPARRRGRPRNARSAPRPRRPPGLLEVLAGVRPPPPPPHPSELRIADMVQPTQRAVGRAAGHAEAPAAVRASSSPPRRWDSTTPDQRHRSRNVTGFGHWRSGRNSSAESGVTPRSRSRRTRRRAQPRGLSAPARPATPSAARGARRRRRARRVPAAPDGRRPSRDRLPETPRTPRARSRSRSA